MSMTYLFTDPEVAQDLGKHKRKVDASVRFWNLNDVQDRCHRRPSVLKVNGNGDVCPMIR
jgi:hypothetical protein